MLIKEQRLKQIIREELKKYYASPDPNIKLGSKGGRFLVYYYNADCPKGGDWHRRGLPGKEDIKGSMESARNYTSFIIDYAQYMADQANEKAGEMKYKPEDFTYDSFLAIDTESGDIFGPANNPATEHDPEAGKMTKCAGGQKLAVKPTQVQGTRAERSK